MNELIFVKDNFNVIHISFMHKGRIQNKIYSWYLPYHLVERVHSGTVAQISINNRRKKVYIHRLTFEINAERHYKEFPLVPYQPGWQIQLICQYLSDLGIEYYRERAFKGLTGIHNKPLLVDISFKINNQWHFIEYHGRHHYFKRGMTTQRFRNIRNNMIEKRRWCSLNHVPYLEIPFFKQKEIHTLVKNFLLLIRTNNDG